MTVIQGLGGPGSAAAITRTRRRAGPDAAFQLAGSSANTGAPAAAPAEGVSLSGLLAAQEAERETVRDRAARRHGQAMLDMLRALQRACLIDGGDSGADALARLADLVGAMPQADDPALASVLQAISVRAAVELARRERARPAHG